MQLSELRGKVDFGIITIREDEFEAVLARFPPAGCVTGRRQYNLQYVSLAGGGSYLVAVVRCIEPGNIEAQSVAHDLLEDLQPHWLLVVGIAGGVPADEFSLGDVIVSNRIHDFNVEALLQDSKPEHALGGGPADKIAATFATNLPARKEVLGTWYSPESVIAQRPAIHLREELLYGDDTWKQKVRSSLARHEKRSHPLVSAGAIASSDRLIKDTETLAIWMKMTRQVRAIEMESAGVYKATYGRQVPTLSIRGISDIVGFKRDPAWTAYACHTAAAFACALMQTRPFEPGTYSVPAAQDQRIQTWVTQWPLPRISEVDPYLLLGVTESDLARRYAKGDERPPYIIRDVDSELDKALTASDLVLVVGHSKAGKSRTAFEAALRLYPQQPLLIPLGGKALAELFRLEAPLQWGSDPTIVWLDELERFLGPGGLSFSVLNALSQARGRVKFFATLTSRRYDDYMSSAGDVEKDTHLILRRFRQVHLSLELTDVETQRARALYPQEPREKLADGLGEHFVAAHELIRKYGTGKESCPAGYALVRVAIDWRRAGLLRPIPEAALQRLAAQYLRFLRIPHIDLTPELYSAALQWARKPIGLHVALLARASEEGPEKSFEAFDYIVDHSDRQGVGIPEEAWRSILQFASPGEAILVGLSAYHRQNRGITAQALEQAIRSGDPDAKPRAIYIRGSVYQEEGKLAEAEASYRLAMDSEPEDVTSSAMIEVARLLQNRGEVAEAARLFQRAFDIQHPDTRLNATLSLGKFFTETGEWDKAESLFKELARSTNAREVALAALNLGRIHQYRGELDEAERLYQQGIDSKQPEAAHLAMNNMGSILMARGDLEGAERLYRQAVASTQPETAALAKANLGAIFYKRGDMAQAERFYQEAIASKQPLPVALATSNLGFILIHRDQRDEAKRLFLQALTFNHLEVNPVAAISLGSLLLEEGELPEASTYFRKAVESNHPEHALRAEWLLGALLEQQGEYAEAERLYRKVLASHRSDLIPGAACSLGSLLQDLDKHAEAEPYFQQAIDSKDPDFELRASLLLGLSVGDNGQLARAETLFRRALHAKDPDISLGACVALAKVLEHRGDLMEAEHFYRMAKESKIEIISTGASLELGKLLLRKGETSEAKLFLQRAAESSDDDVAGPAREVLASFADPVKGSKPSA